MRKMRRMTLNTKLKRLLSCGYTIVTQAMIQLIRWPCKAIFDGTFLQRMKMISAPSGWIGYEQVHRADRKSVYKYTSTHNLSCRRTARNI